MRKTTLAAFAGLAVLAIATPLAAQAPAAPATPAPPAAPPMWPATVGAAPGVIQSLLVDNDEVRIRRLWIPVGLKQEMHFGGGGWTEISMQMSEGDLQIQVDDKIYRSKKGDVVYQPRNPAKHAYTNMGGNPVEIVIFALKKK